MRQLALSAVVMCAFWVGCTNQVCVPGKSEACTGPAGCQGGQQCSADGTAFGACQCSGAGGGSAAGGSAAGGSAAGGSAAGGSTAGGSTAGGSAAGGSTAGGSTAGGSTAGGSTAGGSTAGGSTAGGSTAGGSTAGGSADAGLLPDGGVIPCNVAAQTGCGAGLHCSVVFDGTSAAPRCVPIGSSPSFASCTRVADGGADTCSAGELCSADGCARACSLQQPSCPALTACLSDTDLEPLGLGTCVRTCDIVTQRRLLDNAQACGSATPATPNRGCYLAQTNVFVCAPAGNAANTHRVNPNRTQANACAPGFQQFLSESTASLTRVCVATCAPTATSTSTPANPGGVAPSTCAARGATTADCVFGWSLAVTPVPGGAGTTPSANTWGYCRDPQFYVYDHDQNGSTAAIPLPRCASLTTGDLDGNSEPDNRQWGCAPIP